jgi:peptidoglycan-associated lipoprotein
MKKIIYIITTAILVTACAKTGLLRDANSSFENLEYYKASAKFKKYLEKHDDYDAKVKLAQCYYRMNHFAEAEKQYAKVMHLNIITSQNKLEYAHVLKHNQNYTEATKWFSRYLKENPNDPAVMNELQSCDSLSSYTKNSFLYHLEEFPFNGTQSTFSATWYKDGIAFASERSKDLHAGDINPWTGHGYLDMYYYDLKKESSTPVPQDLSRVINSVLNDGPAVFSKDGNTIFFTRNIQDAKHHPQKNDKSINNFEIYSAQYNGNFWTEPVLLSFDNKAYSVGHPALSNDEQRLYFASDMPGGFGGTDIYYTDKDKTSGEWGAPVNAGGQINTSENEMFPTIYTDLNGIEYLYFSSEGKAGMGGLDLYCSIIMKDNFMADKSGSKKSFENINKEAFTEPQHLNAPLNSAADDFGIIFRADGRSGYLSSNRGAEDGTDKIYSFVKVDPVYFVQITVKQKGTDSVLKDAILEIADINNNKKESAITDANGKVTREISRNSLLNVIAKRESYFTTNGSVENPGRMVAVDTIYLALEMDKIIINKPIRLDNIYYDYDKWDIRADAATELQKLVKVMKENPLITIELSSHTDSRGSDKYNQTLSQKRAQSAVDYIISKGICKERIYAKGYGESRVLNRCKNNAECTETEHQVNRRTEFSVVKMLKLPAQCANK